MKATVLELEKDIEKKIGGYAKKHGCMYLKFTSPAARAVPDRLIITPKGVIGFLEVKRKGNKPTPLQTLKIEELRRQNCRVAWCDSVENGTEFIRILLSTPSDFC